MFQKIISCAALVLLGLLVNIQSSQCIETSQGNEQRERGVEPVLNAWALKQDDESVENNLFSQFSPSTKLRILQLYLDELKRKEFLAEQLATVDQAASSSNNNNVIDRWPVDKRSIYLSSLKRNTVRNFERKRPGWELAYGKRKRSVDNN